MNLHVLEQSVTENFNIMRPRIDRIFTATIDTALRTQRDVNIHSFIKRLNATLKDTRVRVYSEVTAAFDDPNKSAHQYYPAVGGFCYEPGVRNKQSAKIEIIFALYPGVGRLSLSHESWEYFRYRFLKTLKHELVHRAQFSQGRTYGSNLIFRPHVAANLDKTILKQQQYLGDIDEVEAYARDCVEEWHYLHPDIPLTHRQIKREFLDFGGKLPSLQYYYETYRGDSDHPSVRRFFRKIKLWNDIVHPLAHTLPRAPIYVTQDAATKATVELR